MKAFLDIEASSLGDGSFPVEAGWTTEDGLTESHLIREEPTWTAWDDISEQIRGISRDMLAVEGLPAADVARRLVQVLGGCDVYSDAPTADRYWLKMLTDTAGLPPIPLMHVMQAHAEALRPQRDKMPRSAEAALALTIHRRAEAEAWAAVPEQHLAGPDSRRLWVAWKSVCEQVAEALND